MCIWCCTMVKIRCSRCMCSTNEPALRCFHDPFGVTDLFSKLVYFFIDFHLERL
jgi:hypothetical protein